MRDPIRRMQHAGKSYSADSRQLSQQLKSFFDPSCSGPGAPEVGSDHRKLIGLVAPHIDVQAGGPCFAHAYKALMESAAAPTTWVILGTGHEPIDHLFALTPKDFETPFGLIRHDQDFCEELAKLAPQDLRDGEYSHHREHTIEFQAVFLGFSQPEASIVPLLCSFSLEDWNSEREYIDEVAKILKDLAQSREGHVGFISSVDLAHIGPRYGDNFRPHEETLAQHLRADADLLRFLEECDVQGFIGTLQREHNRRRICGLAPLYVLSKILGGVAAGKLLHHTHVTVDQNDSFVTFASMAFYAKDV